MYQKLMVPTVAAVILAASVSANALTVTNRDSVDHTLTMTDLKSERMVTIRPNQSLKDLCLNGCNINVDEGKPVHFGSRETVMIESGKLSTTTFDYE
jgi:hypothetical protein